MTIRTAIQMLEKCPDVCKTRLRGKSPTSQGKSADSYERALPEEDEVLE